MAGEKAARGWSHTQELRAILAALANLLIYNVFNHIVTGMKSFGNLVKFYSHQYIMCGVMDKFNV